MSEGPVFQSLLENIVEEVSRYDPALEETVALLRLHRACARQRDLVPQDKVNSSDTDSQSRADGPILPGALSLRDIEAFGPLPPDTRHLQDQLSKIIDVTLLSLQTLLETSGVGIEDEASDDLKRSTGTQIRANTNSADVLSRVRILKQQVQRQEEVLSISRRSIASLLDKCSQSHDDLEKALVRAVESLPSILSAQQRAQCELVAATIESSLIKLSLLRAQAQAAAFGVGSSGMGKSRVHDSGVKQSTDNLLEKVCDKMQAESRNLDAELQDVDALLRQYDAAAGLAGASGFAQVVEDYARVAQETEECRRDLRRLGWTGE